MRIDLVAEVNLAVAVNRTGHMDVRAAGLVIHLFDLAFRQVGVFFVKRLGRFDYIDRSGGVPFDGTAIGGGVKLPGDAAGSRIDIGFHQQPVGGVVGKFEIDQRYVNGGIQTGKRLVNFIPDYLFIIRDAVSMLVALDNREAAEKGRAEERGANLADSTANTHHSLVADDDQCFSIAVIQADIGQLAGHGEGLAGGYQQPMKTLGSCCNILYALRA